MKKSLENYGGFYIGRYEIGGTLVNPVENNNQIVINSTNWLDLYNSCKKFSSQDESVKGRMIWGCQWDQVCRFITNAKDLNGDTID